MEESRVEKLKSSIIPIKKFSQFLFKVVVSAVAFKIVATSEVTKN